MDQGADSAKPDRPALPTAAPRWLLRLEERTPPHFNQLVVWVLLATSLVLACWLFGPSEGPRQDPSTLIFWLPDSWLASAWPFWLFRGLLVLGGALWLFQRWLPWSCWLAVVGFTGLWSIHVENTYNTAHIFHMANMLLVIQAIWMTADAPAIRHALATGAYWTTPLVPRWVSLASIAYIGIFHTAAGLSKLSFSGGGWASGVSLQIWTYLWGYSASPTTQLILGSRTFTQALQALTLVVETLGILAVVPKLRPWIGLGLLAFYAGVLLTFDYGFQFNALLTALYLLPCERWISSWAARRHRARAEFTPGE